MTNFSADSGSKAVADIEKGESLERLREHADVLEVNHAETSSRGADEEVVLADVAMVDG